MSTKTDWTSRVDAYLSENADVNYITLSELNERVLKASPFGHRERTFLGGILRGLGWVKATHRFPDGQPGTNRQRECFRRPGEWEHMRALRDGKIPEGHVLKGVSTLVGEDGKPKLQWQKTSLHHDQLLEQVREATKALVEDARGAFKPVPLRRTNFDTDVLSVYPMGDPHLGMYAWAEETGNDFDCEIAERLMIEAAARLVAGAPATDEAMLVNVGDFFHSDNLENRTSRSGHALDVDSRWPRVLRIGVNLMRTMISLLLKKHKHVTVKNVPGNHDDMSAVTLNMLLQAYFENEPRVTIPDNLTNFSRHRFGKVLLGFHHGHDAKMEQLPAIMASEWPEDWGATRHRFWLTGHIHHQQWKDLPGCSVESFRTLAGRDKWAASKGYKSPRDMYRLSFHREYGDLGRARESLEMIEAAVGKAA